jgi:multidrug efflux pump subunit AcrB
VASSHWNARELYSSSAPVLDFANVPNVSTNFLVYKNWKDRTKGLTQDKIVSNLNRELAGIQEALAFASGPS